MDVLIDQTRYELMYNCSRYPVDAIPVEVRRKMGYGIAVLVLAVTFTFSNAVCLRTICKFLHHSAYKILFIIGLNDAILLSHYGIYGIFLIQGTEFCSAPILQYSQGMIGQFCWGQTTTLQLLLAIERCLAQIWPQFAKSVFDGLRILLWLLFVLFYSVYLAYFSKPAILSSTIGTMIPDPFLAYRSANESSEMHEMFKNDSDRFHAHTIAIALPSVYFLFGILLSLKWAQVQNQPNGQQMEMRRSIFIQIFTVSILEFSACALISAAYLIRLPHIIISPIILFITMICGIIGVNQNCFETIRLKPKFNICLPSLIYLLFNKTLRSECLRQLGCNKAQPVSRTGTIKNAWT